MPSTPASATQNAPSKFLVPGPPEPARPRPGPDLQRGTTLSLSSSPASSTSTVPPSMPNDTPSTKEQAPSTSVSASRTGTLMTASSPVNIMTRPPKIPTFFKNGDSGAGEVAMSEEQEEKRYRQDHASPLSRIDQEGKGDMEEGEEEDRSSGENHSGTRMSAHAPQEDQHEQQDPPSQSRHQSLTDGLHGHRPDRHLFPYRSVPENWRAMKTFLRRFFLVLLIVPAWTVPMVLTAQREHEQHLLQQQQGNASAEDGHVASGVGGGGHGVELSKGVNLAVFLLNMLVMMHLGKAAGVALEELIPRLGASFVSVLDAMTSTTVELAVAVFALKSGLVRVVQAAMLGAILNDLLLIMGIAMTVGGYLHKTQHLKKATTQTAMNILMICSICYVVPVALDVTLTNTRTQNALHLNNTTSALPNNATESYSNTTHVDIQQLIEQTKAIRSGVDRDILTLSKAMAVILLVVYGCCLFYQYRSQSFLVKSGVHEHPVKNEGDGDDEGELAVKKKKRTTATRRYTHYWFAGLAYATALAAQIYSAKLLVHAVESLGRQFHLNDSFVGFVLLPIVLVADLQEEVLAIRESQANHFDKSVALMVGSCMQIALLVTPLLVLMGWVMDVPMTFRFTIMEATILTGAVLTVNFILVDHETTWLEGLTLVGIFVLCAIAFYYDLSSAMDMLPGEGSIADGGGGGGHESR